MKRASPIFHCRTCSGNPWFSENGAILINTARTTMDYRNKSGNDNWGEDVTLNPISQVLP